MDEDEIIEYQSIPRNCPKCGMHGDIGIQIEHIKRGDIEYLKCLCSRCGYWWRMKTKEA